MNARLYRLIFSRRTGTWVAASEIARSHQRVGGSRHKATRAIVGAALMAGAALVHVAFAQTPAGLIPDATRVWRNAAINADPAKTNARAMWIDQTQPKAILNWQRLNLAPGETLHFEQQSASWSALNRIYDASPSVIQGAISAKGEIYLINSNGILFGQGAQVNTGGLVASTLNISDQVFEKGILSITNGDPAFTFEGDAAQFGRSFVRVEHGADIRTADGGRVMMFAARVENAGTITTPGGQTILAAGAKVYLTASQDVRLRGLLVEVDPFSDGSADIGGTVSNESVASRVGEIVADRGNVTLIGFAVNQAGRISATTSVSANGSIYLLARDKTALVTGGVQVQRVATRTGNVTLSGGSVTQVLPKVGDGETSFAAQDFTPSEISVQAGKILVDSGALVRAASGLITVTALKDPSAPTFQVLNSSVNDSRIVVMPGAILDASGTTGIQVPVARNIVTAELRGNELRDSPLQRGGILQGAKIQVDVRKGTPLADVSGYTSQIKLDVGERTATGGTIALRSEGDVVVASGATLNVSGGYIDYTSGLIATTKLVSQGRIYDISQAKPDIVYQQVFTGAPTLDPGYREGKNAGTIEINARALALDGSLLGGAVAGPYQRNATSAPKGGTLIIGDPSGSGQLASPDFRLSDVTLSSTAGSLPASFFDDPLGASLGARAALTTIWTQPVSGGGFSQLTITSNRTLVQPSTAPLTLPAGGSVKLLGYDVRVQGDIQVPSGSITISAYGTVTAPGTTPSVSVSDGSRLIAAGNWTNDYWALVRGTGLSGGIGKDGGTITIESVGSVTLGSGSLLDVSGGASLDNTKTVSAGAPGSIALASGVTQLSGFYPLNLGGELRGYGLDKGGSLTLTANAVLIGNGAASNRLQLAPATYGMGGFSSITTVGRFGLEFSPDVSIAPMVASYVLGADAISRPSAQFLSGLAIPSVLPAYLRPSMQLQFSAPDILLGDLRMPVGAQIDAGPAGQVTFAAGNTLFVDGAVRAPAGSIRLAISSVPGAGLDPGYVATQTLWVGSHAQLLAGGTLISHIDAHGYRVGDVLDGGTITVAASRGYVVLEQGSVLDVSGTIGTLDLARNGPLGPIISPIAVPSNAGSIILSSREGIFSDATLRGVAGGAGARGGSFQLTLDRAGAITIDGVDSPYPDVQRTVELRDSGENVPTGLIFGTALDSALYNGKARISTSELARGAFSDATIVAENGILFASSVTLSLPGQLTLDAPRITGASGVSVDLGATVLNLTNRNPRYQSAIAAAPGDAKFNAAGRLLTLQGAIALQGWSEVRLAASSELRLDGVVAAGTDPDVPRGSLSFSGALALVAPVIYPSTLTQYSIVGTGSDSRIRVEANGAASTPLSAGASVLVQAGSIVQDGHLFAPFGQITLDAAQSLSLGAGSITSVSGTGVTAPFGNVENGQEWLYALGDGRTLRISAPTEKSIVLKAPAVDIAVGAKVDLSGGGDLYAYEFVPGLGGSSDYLASSSVYAVIPGFQGDFAPRDLAYSSTSDLNAGDKIYLSGGAGLPAGFYTLLPARYALLPGAFVVSRFGTSQDAAASRNYKMVNGAAVAAGYRVFDAGQTREARTSSYLIEPASVLRAKVEYASYSATNFFQAAGERSDTGVGRLPSDAGRLLLAAQNSLAINGILSFAHAQGARGGLIDIEAPRLAVIGSGVTPLTGYLALSVEQLNQTGAESVLIGGSRSSSAGGVMVESGATDVVVDTGGSILILPEFIATATDRVVVAAGSRVAAAGSTGPQSALILNGDGALVRVSAADGLSVTRTNPAGSQGSLVIENNVSLRGATIELDASSRTFIDPTSHVDARAVSLASGRIALGDVPLGLDALVVGGDLLTQIGSASSLRLRSYKSIDFFGDVALGTVNQSAEPNLYLLILDAPALVGNGTAQSAVTVKAAQVRLQNTTQRVETVDSAGLGSLTIDVLGTSGQASSGIASIGGGEISIGGFANMHLAAGRSILGDGTAVLNVDGNLELIAPKLTVNAGANVRLVANGQLNVLPGTSTLSAAAAAGGAGGALYLSGTGVRHAGVIDAPAGVVQLEVRGGGDLVLEAGSVISARGVSAVFDGQMASAPAGSVILTAGTGRIITQASSLIDVSAVPGSNAGMISIVGGQAVADLKGDLRGQADDLHRAGSFQAFANHFGSETEQGGAILALLNRLGTSGFSDVGVRAASGSILLAGGPGVELQGHRISLTADNGSIEIGSTFALSDPKDARLSLWAMGDVIVQGGTHLSARTTGAAVDGGAIDLGSSQGWVRLGAGSKFDVSGATGSSGGAIHLRVGRTDGGVGNQVQLADQGAVAVGASSVVLEGVRVYSDVTAISALGGTGQLSISDAMADVEGFMSSSSGLLTQYASFVTTVRPGVEVRSSSNLELLDAWNFYNDSRPGGVPGYLTLRAAGDLLISNSISDGFSSAATSGQLRAGSSWSYNLVGGAALSSADILATVPRPDAGDVVVAAGTLVRTGDGQISIHAGRDFKLAAETAVVYTAGVPSAAVPGFTVPSGVTFSEGGGDVRIQAERDVIGAPTTQLVSNWLWRRGTTTTNSTTGVTTFLPQRNTTWFPQFSKFQQNVGALGGGDVTVTAGRNVVDLSVMLPTQGRMPGPRPDAATLVVTGGGDLYTRAGGDILGGQFLVMRGTGQLQANGSLGLGTSPVADRPELALFPVLELADGQFDVHAGRSLTIESAFNVTMLPLTLANSPNTLGDSFFSTYSEASAVHLVSLLGDVSIQASAIRLAELARANTSSLDRLGFGGAAESQGLTILPPTFTAVALSGSVSVEGSSTYLYPAPRGHLDILAAASVSINGSLIMSDADPDLIALPSTPANNSELSVDFITRSPLAPAGHAATRLLHEGDTGITRIVARDGDIVGVQGAILASATPVRAIAGRDIDNLFLVAQNLAPGDISLVSAGRDIRYELSRNAGTGGLLPNPNHVNIGGPGLLEVIADRDVDLGSSFGLVTRGSLNNPLLPDVGASIRVTAGSRATIDAAAFAAAYLQPNATNYRSELVTFMQAQTGNSGLSQDEAVDAFLRASDDTRRQFASLVSDKEFQRRYLRPAGTPGVVTSYLTQWNAFAVEHGFAPDNPPPSQLLEFQLSVLWTELRASGRAAVATGATPGDYSRGFAALNALGLDGPYRHSGRLDLIFSQIKTERGGDIDLLVPGGGVDVGLATPPQGFSKGPGSLGIVTVKGGDVAALASGNFQVNQSRVFTLEGGNILIWSSRGDIDAGRGAKTAISAPPPVITVNAQGQFVVEFPGAATGSGIGVLLTRPDVPAGDVDLIAPTGTVNAGDAGIRSSGRVTIAATRVIGADNISAAGPVVGVPVAQSSALGSVSTSSALAEATKSTDQVTGSISDAARASQAEPTARPSFITVEVIGVGEDEADRRRTQDSQ